MIRESLSSINPAGSGFYRILWYLSAPIAGASQNLTAWRIFTIAGRKQKTGQIAQWRIPVVTIGDRSMSSMPTGPETIAA